MDIYIEKHESEIVKSVKKQFTDLGFWIEDNNGDVINVEIIDLNLQETYLIDINIEEKLFNFELNFEIDFKADVIYEDYSYATYDKEDEIYYNVKDINKSVEQTRDLNVNVGINYNEKKETTEISEIEFETYNDISINIDEDDGWPYK